MLLFIGSNNLFPPEKLDFFPRDDAFVGNRHRRYLITLEVIWCALRVAINSATDNFQSVGCRSSMQ